MSKIVDLKDYRRQALERRGLGPWRRRFGEPLHEGSRLTELSDRTLHLLARPGTGSTEAFYELVMGIRGLGPAAKFGYLEKPRQMEVVDLHLFLADRARFEVMRRLGWLEKVPGDHYGLVEMVLSFETVRAFCREHPPELSRTRAGYGDYRRQHPRDREAYIRRMLPAALEAFGRRVGG